MPIERTVTMKAPKYDAVVTHPDCPITARITGDTVELTRPGARAILRLGTEEWVGFAHLMLDLQGALAEKAEVEGAVFTFPWEQGDPEAEALVEAAPGGEDDEQSAPPVVEAVEPGTPIPPRVSA